MSVSNLRLNLKNVNAFVIFCLFRFYSFCIRCKKA